jgi:hypothetical protein
MQSLRHFRSVFDVSPGGANTKPWPSLIGEVRAWISRNEGAELKGFFFSGGDWTGGLPRRARVRVQSLSDGGPTPDMWAVRYEHLDTEIKARRWTADVSVTQVGAREWRLAVELRHELRSDYVGPEPPMPQPSSPRLVTGLLESRHWVCRVGKQRLTTQPILLKVGHGHEFERLLRDGNRLIPLVLVSCDRNTGVPALDSVRLSRALAGTGVVYVCESPECDDELAHFLPYRFRSGNGTVRIYAPGLDFSHEWTAARHRFFVGKDIEELGDDEVIGQIVRALTRSDAWHGLQATVLSVDDIEARIRERRLSALKQSGTTSQEQKNELMTLFEEENVRLEAELKKTKEELEGEIGRRKDLDDTVARLEFEIDQARTASAEARKEAAAHQGALQEVLSLDALPEEVMDVANLAARLSGGRIVLSEAALTSLKKSEFSRGKEANAVVWRCLRAMDRELFDLVMTDLPAVQISETFENRTKFGLTWTESKETKRDNRLMAKRRFVHDGKEWDMTPHVKWGNSAPKCLRVYFAVDRDQKRLIVGHCGDHLDTYGTRRRKQ